MAQRYGTIATQTRSRASVLVVYVVFCVFVYSFAGLIRRTLPPTFSDTAITDRHSETTIFQLRAHWVRISWSIESEKSFGHVPPVGVEPSTSCMLGEHPIHKKSSSLHSLLASNIANTVYNTLEAAYRLNKINNSVYLSVCINLIHKSRSSVMNVSEFEF